MASITFGSIVAEARGSVGTVAYARNQWGAYAKTRTTPTNPNTAAQANARLMMRNSVAQWQALTNDQRLAYNAAAFNYLKQNRVGMSYALTGYNLFIRHAMLCEIMLAGSPTQVKAPMMTGITRLTTVNSVAGVLSGNFTGIPFQSQRFYSIFATPPRAASRLAFNPSTSRRLVNYGPPIVDTTVNFTAEWVAQYGPVAGHIGKLTTIGIRQFSLVSAELTQPQYLNLLIA